MQVIAVLPGCALADHLIAQAIAVLGPRDPIAFIHHTGIRGVVVSQLTGGLAIDGLATADAVDVIAKAEALPVHRVTS